MHDQSLLLYKMPHLARCAILAALYLLDPSSSRAQSGQASQSSSPQANQSALAQVKILTDRVAVLEQKLSRLEQKVLNDEAGSQLTPQTATPSGGDTPSTPAVPGSALSKADQSLLAQMQAQINQLQNANKTETTSVFHPKNADNSDGGHVITAPFQIVDDKGFAIVDVEASSAGKGFEGLRVFAKNDSFTQIGASSATGYANVGVHLADDPNGRIGFGLYPDGRPAFSISKKGSRDIELALTDNPTGGELDFYNDTGNQPVVQLGAQPGSGDGWGLFSTAAGKEQIRLLPKPMGGDVEMVGPEGAFSVWNSVVLGLVPLRGAAAH